MSHEPARIYRERLEARTADVADCARREASLSTARLVVFGAGALAAVLAYQGESAGVVLAVVSVLAFATLAIIHERVIRRHERARRATTFYERGLARVQHTFRGTGATGNAYLDPHHPYAGDLDVFGEGSLFEWICSARTIGGEARLAGWFLEPSPRAEVLARREAVEELRDRLDLREDLAVLAEDARVELHPETLSNWGEAPAVGLTPRHRLIAAVLAVAATLALVAWILGAGPIPMLVLIAAEVGFAYSVKERVTAVLHAVDAPARELGILAAIFERIEAERFTSPALAGLRARLDTDGLPPSRQIQRLGRLLDLVENRRNQIFAPIAALWLWGTQFACAIEAWRTEVGPKLHEWVDAVSELEALLSLAGNAWEQPDAIWAELAPGETRLEGTGIGHPLLPAATRVRNDIRLDAARPLIVISGSNMSGKSTWLRSIGVNVVLAWAGGVVCAESLTVSPLRVGASIRIVDSLQEGASHFYAEITRLRTILDLTEGTAPAPTLFLLDEILHGTNSRDRAAGAEAVVLELVKRGAIGLVTTHDLTLAGIADRLGERATNMHFADHLEDGEMHFDYKVRAGVVERSNALALMRSVGLPVD